MMWRLSLSLLTIFGVFIQGCTSHDSRRTESDGGRRPSQQQTRGGERTGSEPEMAAVVPRRLIMVGTVQSLTATSLLLSPEETWLREKAKEVSFGIRYYTVRRGNPQLGSRAVVFYIFFRDKKLATLIVAVPKQESAPGSIDPDKSGGLAKQESAPGSIDPDKPGGLAKTPPFDFDAMDSELKHLNAEAERATLDYYRLSWKNLDPQAHENVKVFAGLFGTLPPDEVRFGIGEVVSITETHLILKDRSLKGKSRFVLNTDTVIEGMPRQGDKVIIRYFLPIQKTNQRVLLSVTPRDSSTLNPIREASKGAQTTSRQD